VHLTGIRQGTFISRYAIFQSTMPGEMAGDCTPLSPLIKVLNMPLISSPYQIYRGDGPQKFKLKS